MEYVISHCISGSILLLESHDYLFFAIFPYDRIAFCSIGMDYRDV
jgi:hypothetical protein